MDVPAKLAEARHALDEGHPHKASRILDLDARSWEGQTLQDNDFVIWADE